MAERNTLNTSYLRFVVCFASQPLLRMKEKRSYYTKANNAMSSYAQIPALDPCDPQPNYQTLFFPHASMGKKKEEGLGTRQGYPRQRFEPCLFL